MFTDDQRTDEQTTLTYQIKKISYFDNTCELKQTHTLHGILLLTDTKGSFTLNGKVYSAERGKTIIVHSNPVHEQQIEFDQPTSGYHFQFYALKEQKDGVFMPSRLSCPMMLYPAHPYLLNEKAEEIVKHQNRSSSWSKMKANTSFQEFIYLLFHELNANESESIQQLIQSSKDYIDSNYQSDITREKLAQKAGLHVDYYSRKFKEYYHTTPIAYLNNVRMNHAKQLLLQTHLTIHSIAKQVGFNDEFYFSRKFKTKEGFSPTVYINKVKRSNKIASLNHLVTGHLIALGLEPYAAIMNHSFPAVSRLNKTLSLGENEPDLEKLLSTKPELIVRCASNKQTQSTKEGLFTHIAPTLTLDFQENWRIHLDKIARLLGREREAATFLTKYTEKAISLNSNCINKLVGRRFLSLG
ncbi:AraC family transcriptional regulator [Bacillus sp. JCM 19041]|uniref:helix-turn-helix domain-containing protein n=1 Tax=Bacillus sp. JCM 19041 TaxID=1460637 RepID=UPI0006D1A6B0